MIVIGNHIVWEWFEHAACVWGWMWTWVIVWASTALREIVQKWAPTLEWLPQELLYPTSVSDQGGCQVIWPARHWGFIFVLIRFPLLQRDTMTKATLTKDNIWLGLAYRFRGSVHYHQGRKHGSMQAEELRVLLLHPKANRRRVASRQLGVSKPTHTVTQFLQWVHTYSNKAPPPN